MSPLSCSFLRRFANNLDISRGAEGTVYFSDSHELPDVLKHMPGERPFFDPMISAMKVMLMVKGEGRRRRCHQLKRGVKCPG